jgi:hypothetical protein
MFQKLYRHLEQINASTRRQETSVEHAEEWARKISDQLAELNIVVRSLEREPPRRPARLVGIFLAGVGITVLGLLAVYTFRLSAMTNSARDKSTASLEAYGILNTRFSTVAGKTVSLEAGTERLDSLVRQQAQTIDLLKRMNASTIRATNYFQRELYRPQQQERTQALLR